MGRFLFGVKLGARPASLTISQLMNERPDTAQHHLH
jgi:hypothetical protein